jgi:hypothetical protein
LGHCHVVLHELQGGLLPNVQILHVVDDRLHLGLWLAPTPTTRAWDICRR